MIIRELRDVPKRYSKYSVYVDTPFGQEEYNFDHESEAKQEWDYQNATDNIASLIDNETGAEWDGYQWRF